MSCAQLGHRLSRDVDLVCRRAEDVRSLVRDFSEIDLELALKKDAGMDPGVLAWLLGQFPLAPLPTMIASLTTDELRAFRDGLREKFRVLAVGE